MKTIYVSDDQKVFTSAAKCRKHERVTNRRVSVPLYLLREAIRQATPYMVSAKERRELAAELQKWMPK